MFYVGPGMLLALAVAGIILAVNFKNNDTRRQNSLPPIVERSVVVSADEGASPTPEIRFILDRAATLGLSDDQELRLKGLQSEWEQLYYPKIRKAEAAAREVADYLAQAERNKKTPVAQIQREAEPVTALSSEISSARSSYWSKAMQELDMQQRAVVERERKADYDAKRKAMAEAVKQR